VAAGYALHRLGAEVVTVEKRTIAGWVHYLDAPDGELTITELMAKCLVDMRDNLVISRVASEHIEGMLGAIDEMCSRMDAEYKGDGQVRAALDAARDERRAMTAGQRNGETP
jgi:hypothetical protein